MSRYRVTGTVFGHEVYTNGGSDAYWQDDNKSVPRDEEGNAGPDANHPCPKCHKLPGPSGHDPCIDQLEGVRFACCGHGNPSNSYVAFDEEDDTGRPKIFRGNEAIEYFRIAK